MSIQPGATAFTVTPAAARSIAKRTAGAKNRRQGYLRGLRQLGLLPLPALVLLIIGAVWEAYSRRYLVYPLSQLLL